MTRPSNSYRPILESLEARDLLSAASWPGFAHDAQHSGISGVASQSLEAVHWQVSVDHCFNPGIHHASPIVTAANTVIVPVRTGCNNTYRLEGRRGSDGTLLWSHPTNYTGSTFSPALTPRNRLYFPGSGGTVYYMDDPDTPGAPVSGRLAFYGIENHNRLFDQTVFINTPLTVDARGTIFFGFTTTGSPPLNLQGGIARLNFQGIGSWIPASRVSGDKTMTKAARYAAPALSHDERVLYVVVNNAQEKGYLAALDSATLRPTARVKPLDAQTGLEAYVSDVSSATPTVGPDGDVYYGVIENPYGTNSARGWMMHYSGDLSETKVPGAFGWDNTPSIVPRSMVPSYDGPSPYLIVTKYNQYVLEDYQIAVLDPNTIMVDPYTGVRVMKTILTVDGPTSGAEWCINDAAVDPATGSVLANSEDGKVYRWHLATNTLSQSVVINTGVSQAYTPTLIGADGTVYSINAGQLYAVGAARSTSSDADPVLAVVPVEVAAVEIQSAASISVHSRARILGNGMTAAKSEEPDEFRAADVPAWRPIARRLLSVMEVRYLLDHESAPVDNPVDSATQSP
jgi:hypothetical protein